MLPGKKQHDQAGQKQGEPNSLFKEKLHLDNKLKELYFPIEFSRDEKLSIQPCTRGPTG